VAGLTRRELLKHRPGRTRGAGAASEPSRTPALSDGHLVSGHDRLAALARSRALDHGLYNYDQDPHTLAIANSDGQQVSDTVAVPPGHTGTPVTLTINLPPGTYVLFCTLPQHAADGMETTIVVK
jgi:hypothetical protein